MAAPGALQAAAAAADTPPHEVALRHARAQELQAGDLLECLEFYAVLGFSVVDGSRYVNLTTIRDARDAAGHKLPESMSSVKAAVMEGEFFGVRPRGGRDAIRVVTRTELGELLEKHVREESVEIKFRKAVTQGNYKAALVALVEACRGDQSVVHGVPAPAAGTAVGKALTKRIATTAKAMLPTEGEVRVMRGIVRHLDARTGRATIDEYVPAHTDDDGTVHPFRRQERVADLRTIEELAFGGMRFVVSTTPLGRSIRAERKRTGAPAAEDAPLQRQHVVVDDLQPGDLVHCLEHYMVLRPAGQAPAGHASRPPSVSLTTIRGIDGVPESFSAPVASLICSEFFAVRPQGGRDAIRVVTRTELAKVIERHVGAHAMEITFHKAIGVAALKAKIQTFLDECRSHDWQDNILSKHASAAAKTMLPLAGELRVMQGIVTRLCPYTGRATVQECIPTFRDGDRQRCTGFTRQERVADLRTVEEVKVGGLHFVASTSTLGKALTKERNKARAGAGAGAGAGAATRTRKRARKK